MSVPSKWRQHIEAWQSSGLSQRDYCAQQQINFRTFTARLSEYRKLPNVASVSLIPIHIESTGIDRNVKIFVMLFCTKVGQYTEEEFETAFGQFKATHKPFFFTYFKDAEISTGSANKRDLMSLWAFQEKLDKLGHFYTVYKNIDELKFKFNQQLDKLAANGFIELKPNQDNTAATSGLSVRDSKNVVAGSSVNTGGGDFIVGDRTTTKE